MRDRYAELLPFVADRADLDYVFGEIAGELGAGHVYVQPPPGNRVPRVEGGLLGAEIRPDASGAFRIEKIYAGENWHENFRSPLTEPGVRVNEGDYILAVDGVPTKGVDNFYRLLEAKGAGAVTLLVNGTPSASGARTRARAADHERAGAALSRLGREPAPHSSTRRRTDGSATSTCRTPAKKGTASCSRASTRRRRRRRSSSTCATTAAGSSPTG